MLALTALVGFTLALLPIVLTPGASFTLASAKGAAGDPNRCCLCHRRDWGWHPHARRARGLVHEFWRRTISLIHDGANGEVQLGGVG